MKKLLVATAIVMSPVAAYAQNTEDCTNMANRWSDVYSNAPALADMTNLFLPNALVFGTNSTTLATAAADVEAYFTPVYARAVRSTNVIQSQSVIQVSDTAWVIAGLYEFTAYSQDAARTETKTPARFHFVVAREGDACKIAAFNSSRLPG